MVTFCWAVKGGSGTSVVAASMALGASRPSLLVDLDGELPIVLGGTEPPGPGVADWLASGAPATRLDELIVEVTDAVVLLPWTSGADRRPEPGSTTERWNELATWLRGWADRNGGTVTVDGGSRAAAPPLAVLTEHRLLVLRPCYLALRRAIAAEPAPTGVILVEEPGRTLGRRDVERALGCPVLAAVDVDPAIARAVDAGLTASRLPRGHLRRLGAVA
jgi:hypothetical protein